MTAATSAASAVARWLDENIFELGREVRLSYLPPLMVYLAYGVQALTAIVGTFFVKDYLGLSAAFLAGLGFWINVPWMLKMPLGHLVDLMWRWKALLVFLGGALLAASFVIMYALIAHTGMMRAIMPAAAWYVLATLLAPVGYVIQDVVADAMTVEAVPVVDERGRPYDPHRIKLMHTTMQTLGRVAVVGGTILVAVINLVMFSGVETMSAADKAMIYSRIYLMALAIPVISVAGVVLAAVVQRRRLARLRRHGISREEAAAMVIHQQELTEPNWWILGGSLLFVAFALSMGLSGVPYDQEIIFIGSTAIVIFLMARLFRELTPELRRAIVGTAVIIFVFRAMPLPGAGATWWRIDVLGFDQQFLSVLSLIVSGLALLGMFIFRRFMAERTIAYVIAFLTVVLSVLYLPDIGMYYGLHHWTARLTNGVVDARFIAIIDTAAESPLQQVAMIPMLAWIANNAPPQLKATFFAVMASFSNLALSLAQLVTKYLNEIFVVTRQVKNPATGAVTVPANYSELGWLFIAVTVIGFVLPLVTIWVIQRTRLRTRQ
jgi:MFS family permease